MAATDGSQVVWSLRLPGVAPETRLAAMDFLVGEAELLDRRRFEEWLDLFTDDLVYVAPVRAVRRARKNDVVEDSTLFEDNKRSMTLRGRRLATDVAWAE